MGEPTKPDSAEQLRPVHRHPIRKIVKRSLLVLIIVLLSLVLYVFWFTTGKPEPTVDYIAMLNEMTRPEGLTAKNNAWPHYERAIQQYVSHPPDAFVTGFSIYRKPWFDDYSELEQQAIQRWIADNETAWQSFAQATEQPHCWKEYKRIEGPGDAIMLNVPTLQIDRYRVAPVRGLMFLGAYRIRSAAHAGRTLAALQDCLTLIRAGVQWNQLGSLHDSLFALAMAKTGHQELLKVVAQAGTGEIDWQELQVDLADAYDSGPLEIHMKLEKLRALDIVQHTFTRGGIGGGHLIPRHLWSLVRLRSVVITASPLPEKSSRQQRWRYLTIALAHARRDATVCQCHRHYDRVTQIMALTPYQLTRRVPSFAGERLHILNYKIHFNSFFHDARYFALGLSTGLAKQTAERQWQLQAQHEATKTVVALKRWQSEHGHYPANLEQLVRAGFLESLPLDPYSDTVLVYRRSDDGFTLYSRGRNMRDDGGVPLIDPNHPSRVWGTDEGGDAVFWPI